MKECEMVLKNSNSTFKEKHGALFEIMSQYNQEAAKLLIEVFPFIKNSTLLAHEVAYTLGQMT